jgi:pilus assembly protein Flp/PilA
MDVRDDSEAGASATEYGLLVVAIAALIVVIVFALGGVVEDLFSDSCEEITAEASTSSTCG